jgi:aspartyl-tRNA(Asn)/glutamyl-tRNA(Gln) amidotransferase subunit A
MSVTEPALLSLTDIADAIAQKKISSREATQSCLDRTAKWQPSLNAYMSIEADTALAAADAADAALAKARSRGVLHGVPLAHKDMYYDAGHVVTCGSHIRRDWVAATTATSLQRLKDAGTIRLGSLQMVEFAYGPTGHNAHYGAVHNPWHVDHVTGGSSSGSGAAVAARLTFAALGSDTGGSIRMPAHFCGVSGLKTTVGLVSRAAVAARLTFAALGSDTGGSIRMPAHFCGVSGLKTTVGLVSRAGAMPLSQSLDTVGPLARTVADCALLTGLMAGADPLDPTTSSRDVPDYMAATKASAKGMTVGIPKAFYVDDLDPETAKILQDTIATLKREGIKVVEVDLPSQPQLTAACQLVLATEAAAIHKRWMIERPQDYGAQVLMRLQNGFAVSGVSYLEALRWRGPALAAYLAAVTGTDAVLAPVSPAAAPTILETDVGNATGAEAMIQRLTRFTRPINFLGLPSLSIPAGFTSSKLPVGMQLIGRPFDEATLMTIGSAFQRATDFHQKCPELA